MMYQVAVAALLAVGVSAGDVKWTGIVNDQQWNTPNNWYPAHVPGPDDFVTIDDAEGKDAVVVLTSDSPVSIHSLSMGNLVANTARLRVLAPLSIASQVNIARNGVLEINSGAAGVACGGVAVQGEWEFVAGTFAGNATVSGFANFHGQGAKVFDSATIKVKSERNMVASGSLQFKNDSTIKSNVGVTATGNNFQCIVMDKSTSNGFFADGFQWSQQA